MRVILFTMLIVAIGCLDMLAADPLKLTPEEKKIVDIADGYLKKTKRDWGMPVEIKQPPNRVNVPDWKKYVDDEKHIWRVVYETPMGEKKALGSRTLFVNTRTNEVIQALRK